MTALSACKKNSPNTNMFSIEKIMVFAKGVNQGIDLSYDSDYFLLVNNDAELDNNCLNLLLEASYGEALVGPAIFYKNNPEIIWQGGGFFSKLKMNITVPDKNKKLILEESQEVDFLSGCILLIPKKSNSSSRKIRRKIFLLWRGFGFLFKSQGKWFKNYLSPKG